MFCNIQLVLFLLGIIVFSPISSLISLSVLKFPMSVPELLCLPFIPILYSRFKFQTIKRAESIAVFLVWMSMFGFGLISSRYPISAMISTARTYFWIIIFFLIFSKKTSFNIRDAYIVCIGSMIGWLIASILNFITISEEETVCYGPMMIIPIILGYNAIKGKLTSFSICTIVFMAIGILSALRRAIFIVVITCIIIFVLLIIFNKRSFSKYCRMFMAIITLFILIYPFLEEFLYTEYRFVYNRIILKSQSFLSGESNSGDDLRFQMINDIFSNPQNFILPKGFVSKQTAIDPSTGSYIDVPLTEIFYSLGIAVGLLLLIYFSILAIKILKYKKKANDNSLIYLLSFCISFSLLFIEGSYISFPYCGAITGYTLGRLKYYSKPNNLGYETNDF